jgi:hypothetical protein
MKQASFWEGERLTLERSLELTTESLRTYGPLYRHWGIASLEQLSMEKVNWLFQPRGGYGYVVPVAALVVKRNPKRVRIAVYNLRTRRFEYKQVRPEKLSPRTEHSIVDDQFPLQSRGGVSA